MISRIKAHRALMDKERARFTASQERAKDEYQILRKAEKHLVHAEEAQRTIQALAQEVQQQAHNKIAQVVSHCLESIFDEPYEFRINFERKRGSTEAQLVFVREGEELDPLSATGGGVVDVAAFALRLAGLALARPRQRSIVVLDEPFKFVSPGYRPAVRRLLEQLASDMGLQFLMVTHMPELQTGKVLEL